MFTYFGDDLFGSIKYSRSRLREKNYAKWIVFSVDGKKIEYEYFITSDIFLYLKMVSTKFYCGYDEDIYISAWAEYGNLTSDRLKEMELDFLDAMVIFFLI